MEDLRQEEVLFFQGKAGALPLYLALREKLPEIGEVEIQVKKSQISLIRRHLFGAVSFTPVRRAKDRPKDFITLTFGLGYRLDSPRIDAAVEAYPGRWTHHILIGGPEQLDDAVLSWLREAAAFAAAK
jgi:hypothetical protein